jgi:hypothetical protein
MADLPVAEAPWTTRLRHGAASGCGGRLAKHPRVSGETEDIYVEEGCERTDLMLPTREFLKQGRYYDFIWKAEERCHGDTSRSAAQQPWFVELAFFVVFCELVGDAFGATRTMRNTSLGKSPAESQPDYRLTDHD